MKSERGVRALLRAPIYRIKKMSYWFAIVLLLLPIITSFLLPLEASAYGLITTRSIKMSSSKAGDTDVTYAVAFSLASTGNVGGIVIDFCDTTPIIGDSCSLPTGFDTNKGSLVLANQTNFSGNTLSVDTTNSTSRTLILTRTAASLSASTALSFDLGSSGGSDGITNPATTNVSFYARILTFDTTAHAQAYTATGANTGLVDAGGIALSTANQITITAKVQERLSFCVYTGVNCAAGGSSITLGDTHGVLDPAGVYIDKNGKYDVSTNASGNVAIRVKGDTLVSGSNTITAVGGTAAISSPGSEQFGFCTYQATGSGLTPASPYDGSGGTGPCSGTTQSAGTGTPGGDNGAKYAFDTTNTNTTYGQTFASKVPGSTSQGIFAFLGNISFSTEAGIYTTTLTFIATATY